MVTGDFAEEGTVEQGPKNKLVFQTVWEIWERVFGAIGT